MKKEKEHINTWPTPSYGASVSETLTEYGVVRYDRLYLNSSIRDLISRAYPANSPCERIELINECIHQRALCLDVNYHYLGLGSFLYEFGMLSNTPRWEYASCSFRTCKDDADKIYMHIDYKHRMWKTVIDDVISQLQAIIDKNTRRAEKSFMEIY